MRKVMLLVALATVATIGVVATSSSGAAPKAPVSAKATVSPALVSWLAKARVATAKYATNLNAAKAAGYGIITKMIPDMGFHYMNPKVTGFDPAKPPILVYEKTGAGWQLGAVEWVFTAKPKTPPLPGATYGAFGAGCHYKDGTYVPAQTQDACPKTAPDSGAAFNFWHPNLITLHVWLWYPNPAGLYSGTNQLVHPFNGS
jgi:hypothetical protein